MQLPYARHTDPASYPLPQVVQTPRLKLRLPVLDDAESVAQARGESFDELHPWFHQSMGDQVQENDPHWQAAVLAKSIEAASRRGCLSYYAWHNDQLIGSVELLPIWRRGQFRLTYWVRSARARQGYGAEAVNAMVRVAFVALDARLVTTGHAEPNKASAGLAHKLGFRVIARQPLGYEMPDGMLVCGIAYAIEDTLVLPPLEISWH